MENFNNGGTHIFWRFFLGGIVTIGGFIIPAQIGTTALWVEIVIKLFTTGMGAALSGFIAILVTDFYKFKVKNKIFKHKKDKENGNDKDEEKAA